MIFEVSLELKRESARYRLFIACFLLMTPFDLWAGSKNLEPNLTFGRSGHTELKLDLYFPTESTLGSPVAVAVYIHGGGWSQGDKSQVLQQPATRELLKRRYAVVAVNYSLAPEHKFPAQIQDCKCAVRFLRVHAEEYHLDPNRIGVFGGSAGGHLAVLLGLTEGNPAFEGNGGWSNQSSRVQAVVDLFGPSDLTAESGAINSNLVRNVFGATSFTDDILRQASPLTYISPETAKTAPPFLIIHGLRDRFVPPSHSQILHDRLKAAGIPSTLILVTNASHALSPASGIPRPSSEDLAKIIADFFDRAMPPPRSVRSR